MHSHDLCWRLLLKVINCTLEVQFSESGRLRCRHLHCSQLPEHDSSPLEVCSAGISSTDNWFFALCLYSLEIRGVRGMIYQVEYLYQFMREDSHVCPTNTCRSARWLAPMDVPPNSLRNPRLSDMSPLSAGSQSTFGCTAKSALHMRLWRWIKTIVVDYFRVIQISSFSEVLS